MRGASAIQELLDQNRGHGPRAFVVWEPVIVSDVAPPTTRVLAKVSDPRAAQYWDPDRSLSRAMLEAASRPDHPFHESASGVDVIWDFVALYPAGARWEKEPPLPTYTGAPIVDVLDELRAELSRPVTSGSP